MRLSAEHRVLEVEGRKAARQERKKEKKSMNFNNSITLFKPQQLSASIMSFSLF